MHKGFRLASAAVVASAIGMAISLASSTAASAATCKQAGEFSIRQKDGFTVQFVNSGGGKGTAFTNKYGAANVTSTTNAAGTKWTYRVYWAHGEVGVYKMTVLSDNFGKGTVSTPGRNVNPVSFQSLGPVVTGC